MKGDGLPDAMSVMSILGYTAETQAPNSEPTTEYVTDRWMKPRRDALVEHVRRRMAEAWIEGHAAGRDYQGDGWNSDAHDPEEDNPYR